MKRLDLAMLRLNLFPVVLLAAACGGDETAPSDDHTPVSYTVLMDEAPMTAPYTFTTGQTVRVHLKFFNASSEDLDVIEAEHFAGLAFDPASLASVTRVADHHYQFDVTGGSPGDGTMEVSFGHDELADETTFPPAAVTVRPPGAAP